jgi:uncharacterized protein
MAFPVDIRGALEALGSQLVIEDSLELSDVVMGDEAFAFPEPAAFAVTLTNTGAGIVAAGEVRAGVTSVCVRCLCVFALDVIGSVEGFYVAPEHAGGIPEEQDVELVRDSCIDLESAVVQAVLVELPFAPLHAPECAGLCASCGADLNEGACACPVETPASPLAGLGELLSGRPYIADEETREDT